MSTANTNDVRVLCTSGETPVMVRGSVSSHNEGTVVVHAAAGAAALSAGDRVVLAFSDEDRGRMAGTVVTVSSAQEGHEIEINCASEHDRDKRDFPRLYAGLPIRYQTVADPTSSAGTAAIGFSWSMAWLAVLSLLLCFLFSSSNKMVST